MNGVVMNVVDQRHDHHHRKQRLGENPNRQADIEDDQFHQPAGVHQHAQQAALPPVHSIEPRGDGDAAKLASDGGKDDDPQRSQR